MAGNSSSANVSQRRSISCPERTGHRFPSYASPEIPSASRRNFRLTSRHVVPSGDSSSTAEKGRDIPLSDSRARSSSMKTPSPEQRRRAFRERSTKSPEAISPPSYPVQEKKTPQDGLPSTPTIPSTLWPERKWLSSWSIVPERRERQWRRKAAVSYCSRVMPQRAPPKKVASGHGSCITPIPSSRRGRTKERSAPGYSASPFTLASAFKRQWARTTTDPLRRIRTLPSVLSETRRTTYPPGFSYEARFPPTTERASKNTWA